MAKREYRDYVEKKVKEIAEALQSDIEDLVDGDIIDEIETSVNEAKEELESIKDLEITDFSDIQSGIENALSILDELSEKLY